MFCDQFLPPAAALPRRRGCCSTSSYTNWAGPVAMLVGVVVSIVLFSNQTEYVGLVPTHVPSIGDLTFEAGFVITAVVYLTWHAMRLRPR